MTASALRLRFILCGVLLCASELLAGAASAQTSITTPLPEGVLARLGNEVITQTELDFYLGRTSLSPELSRVARENAIQLVAQQRQALHTLQRMKQAADLGEARQWALENLAPQEGSEPEEVLAKLAEQSRVAESTLLEQIAFRLSWKKYLAKHLNDKNLAKHFENQRTRFDGTEFRIRMLSLAAPAGESKRRESARKKLEGVREQVDALGGASALPELDGTVQVLSSTWVRGMGDIDNRAIDAVLQLEEGEWSPLFDSASGVHLVQLLERRPGNRDLEEVRDEVRTHMLIYLLDRLAAQSRGQLPLQRVE